MRSPNIRYTPEELAWIEENSTRARAETHAKFVRIFDRADVSCANLTALCKRKRWMTGRSGKFAPGHTPDIKGAQPWMHPNTRATQFKIGQLSGRNATKYKPLGTERLSAEGYVQRKTNEGPSAHRRWEFVHHLNWIAQNGPIPAGHILKCLDGNRLNTAAENWTPIKRGAALRLLGRWNGLNFDEAPPELRPAILATAKLAHAVKELKA